MYAFQYRYDERNRCIYKKLPGVEHVEYTYDNADRMTFSQDGVQRTAGKYTFYEYDALDRLTCRGECTGKSATTNRVEHIKNYYDGYSFIGTTGFTASQYISDSSTYGKGMLTGSVITVLGSSDKLCVAHYFDRKGREIRTVQNNLPGGYEVTTTTYTFSGKPATVNHTHTANGHSTQTEVYTYTYDHADRVSKVQHSLNGVQVTLADYTYDNFGRMLTNSFHGSATNKLTYAYNLRNWLTGISGTNFSQNLYYNSGNGTACYNGNISSMTWQAGGETTSRGYKFTYDGLNRMLNATYGEGSGITTNSGRFSENVTEYDKNGNILSLQRYGQTGASSYGQLDNLTYTLTGNQLSKVEDAVTATAYGTNTAFTNGSSTSGEYSYDTNGNLTKDLNKSISSIQYNVLNLPGVVTFTDGSTITYTYAADGTKLRTVHLIGGVSTQTDYCGSVVYEDSVQKYLLTGTGYVNLDGTKQYHYYLQDHQGNNRVVIDSGGSMKETNHYYPFGGLFASTSIQPYKYNGKELDTKKDLNWYDYGARHYDPVVGRWHVVDSKAEVLYPWSPYNYCLNTPTKYIDENGEFPLASNLIGAAIGAVVEYGSQVIGNIVKDEKITLETFTNIDISDIAVSAGEGFITSGMSTWRKLAVNIVAEGVKNATDTKLGSSGNVEFTYNDIRHPEFFVETSVGLIANQVPNIKSNMFKTKSVHKTTEAARESHHKNGKTFSSNEAKKIQKSTREYNSKVLAFNAGVNDLINGSIGAGTSKSMFIFFGNDEKEKEKK